MGLTAPEQMNTTTGSVHWTRFLAGSLPIDWADHRKAHQAVMALFPRDLSGEPDTRRSGHGILYRIDNVGGQMTVLVQSAIVPVLLPEGAQTMVVPGAAWEFARGDRVGFRVAVNPVRRIGKVDRDVSLEALTSGRLVASGKAREVGIKFDDVPDWLIARLSGALDSVVIVDHFRDATKGGRHRLTIDTFDGLGVVDSPELLDALRRTGVGRAKAFGCGLLTVRAAVDA